MPSPDSTIESARQSISGSGNLRFPGDLGPTAIVMSFQKYRYSGTFGSASKQTTGVIALPIPQTIEDAYGINIGPRDLGSIGAGVVDIAESGAIATLEGAMGSAKEAGQAIAELVKNSGIVGAGASTAQMAKYFSRSAIDGLAPGVGMALDVVNGTTVNPHTTLAFDGVNLKEFNFTWQLAPKNAAESDTLVKIRNRIRNSILPGVQDLAGGPSGGNNSLSRAFLSYPDLVHIYFMGILEDHYIRFKPAMVKNFNINFSPQNGNVIVEGGKPGFVQMSMTIQEAQIHTRGDYGAVSSATSTTTAGSGADSQGEFGGTNDAISEQDTASRASNEPPTFDVDAQGPQ